MSLSQTLADCYNDIRLAFALLTRFGRGVVVHDAELSGALPWFALVGVIIGGMITLPLFLLCSMSGASPWLLAWCYVLLDVSITRALHYDAVADVGDAAGAYSTSQFWNVLYDSRMGAFGAVALFLALSGLLFGVQDTIAAENWLALIYASAFGRVLTVLFACVAPARNPSSLGGKTCAGKSPTIFFMYLLFLGALLWPFAFAPVMGILLVSTCFFVMMWRLARKHGGCNGDFLGTVIVGGQVIFLLFI